MKRILFKNPQKSLFKQLKSIGLTDFYEKSDGNIELKNIPLNKIKVKDISENAYWGNYSDVSLKTELYMDKYYDYKSEAWKSATIDLTDKGIETLQSNIPKGWEIIYNYE